MNENEYSRIMKSLNDLYEECKGEGYNKSFYEFVLELLQELKVSGRPELSDSQLQDVSGGWLSDTYKKRLLAGAMSLFAVSPIGSSAGAITTGNYVPSQVTHDLQIPQKSTSLSDNLKSLGSKSTLKKALTVAGVSAVVGASVMYVAFASRIMLSTTFSALRSVNVPKGKQKSISLDKKVEPLVIFIAINCGSLSKMLKSGELSNIRERVMKGPSKGQYHFATEKVISDILDNLSDSGMNFDDNTQSDNHVKDSNKLKTELVKITDKIHSDFNKSFNENPELEKNINKALSKNSGSLSNRTEVLSNKQTETQGFVSAVNNKFVGKSDSNKVTTKKASSNKLIGKKEQPSVDDKAFEASKEDDEIIKAQQSPVLKTAPESKNVNKSWVEKTLPTIDTNNQAPIFDVKTFETIKGNESPTAQKSLDAGAISEDKTAIVAQTEKTKKSEHVTELQTKNEDKKTENFEEILKNAKKDLKKIPKIDKKIKSVNDSSDSLLKSILDKKDNLHHW